MILRYSPSHLVALWGGIAGLSFIFFQPIFMIIGFNGLLWQLRNSKSYSQTLKIAAVFNLFYFVTQLYWICLGPKTVGMWYIVPITFVGIPLLASIFPTIATLLYHPFRHYKVFSCLAFTLLWSIGEWCRGNFFTGFPWNLTGYSWDLPILQITSFIGIYGISLWLNLFNVIWFSRNKILIAIVCIITSSIWLYGSHVLKNPLSYTGYNIRLIQPSIQQAEKWSKEHLQRNFRIYTLLTEQPGEKPLNLVIWSESAIPFFINELSPSLTTPSPHLKEIRPIIPLGGFLITGAPGRDERNIYNSLFIINPLGQIKGVYAKNHLVPFGEYVPLRWLNPFPKITHGLTDYSAGSGIKTISLEGIPSFSPLICYEVIFPGQVVGNPRPKWIVNLTNDAWFGDSAGPKQHLKIAQVRAIEEGLPLVRSANNGISAVVSPHGQILHRLNYNEVGFIDFDLPQNLEATFYSRHKEQVFFYMILLLIALCISYKKLKAPKYLIKDY